MDIAARTVRVVGQYVELKNGARVLGPPKLAASGVPAGFRFHDLRHTGNTLAASTGASIRELMVRLGHASPRAALIYQHATELVTGALSQNRPACFKRSLLNW